METELMLLFPENKRAPGQTCDFTQDDDGWDEKDIKECLGLVMELKQIFRYERYEMLYDLKNISAFCYPHLNNRHTLFNRKYVLFTLLKGMRNWRNRSEQHGETCVLHGTELKGDTISEIAVRKLRRPGDSFALVDCMALIDGCTPCVVSVDSLSVSVGILGLDDSSFYVWFCENRKPKRSYNLNPKHGENGKGNWAGESRLLGSSEEARALLKYAIGEAYRGPLYCWDAKYGYYMEYKNELNDTYHSFHLEGEDVKRIPHQVKRLIDKFQK